MKKFLGFMAFLFITVFNVSMQAQTCVGPLTVTVAGASSGQPLGITLLSQTSINCGQPTASATVVGTGGSPAYTYSKDGIDFSNTDGILTGLTVGLNTITVKDINGCTAQQLVTILSYPVTNTSDNLHFATIQAAIDAPTTTDGEVITVCAGTYTETININKALTINGPNVGISGSGVRAPEAILLNCSIDVNNGGTTILDGLHVLRTDALVVDQIVLDGSGVNTVQNCIFERNGSATGTAARGVATSAGGGVKNILNNKFTGDISGGLFSGHKTWNNAMYINGGTATVNITGNTIMNSRTGLSIDDYTINVITSTNTFDNNGTHIGLGGTSPTTGSFVLGANDFKAAASAIVNLSNVTTAFRLDMTSSTWLGTSFSALPNATLFAIEAGMFHRGRSGRNGLVTYKTNNQYVILANPSIQLAVDYAPDGGIVNLVEGTFNQSVNVTKSLTLQGGSNDKTLHILSGTGLGTTSGIVLANGVTNVTIQNLTVQNFTGASGNANAGIYGMGGNNYTTVTNVALLNNPTASGFYANGPVDNVSITNSMVTNNGGGARGIVIWNGLKTNITISGNMVTNNTCCGIELQDGNASGVNISTNTIDVGGGDNAIGVVGLNTSVGANTINNNTITGGGRFGIEVKNPDGGVTVNGNTVTLSSQNSDVRDRAGIAIFRRGVTAGNVDVPNGVTITGNTVTGYQQSSTSEGFGIVVEGTNHTVTGNIVTSCEVGILQQQNPSNYPGDADQSNLVDQYFGRGNSPLTCGNNISGNTFSSNGLDTRNIISSGTVVTNMNTAEIFCSIQSAVNDAQTLNGHTLLVQPGTYNEQVLINKQLTIKNATAVRPVINFTGTPSLGSGALTLFEVTAPNVTIDSLEFSVDITKLGSAILASSATLNNLTVVDNRINPYRSAAGTVSFGLRNAISVNVTPRVSSNNPTIDVQKNTITYNTGVDLIAGNTDDAGFRSGIATDEGGGIVSLNTITTISHDVLLRFGGNPAGMSITQNNLNGGGLELSDQNAACGPLTVSNNTFTGAGAPGTAKLRVKNNYDNIVHSISNNTFNTFDWGVSLENMRGVTLNSNTFNGDAATDRHVVVNTKSISSNSNLIVQVPVDAVMTSNNFTGQGIALTFLNHDSDNDSYGTFTIGTAGNENNFASTLTNFVTFDNQTGSSNTSIFPTYPTTGNWPTTMACWDQDLAAEHNRFDVGGGLELPVSMDATDRNVLETKLTHDPDFACLGKIRYFYPIHNVTQNTYHEFIQAAIDAVTTVNGDVISVPAGTYAENLVVTKSLTINGPNAEIDPCSGSRVAEAILTTAVSDIAGSSAYSVVDIQASNVSIKGFTIDGDNTSITTGKTSTNGADIDIALGITRYVTGDSLNVSNNILKNLSYFAVELYDFPVNPSNWPGAVPSAGNVISNNKIQDLGTYDATSGISFWGGGVLLYNNQYATVTNNCMTNVRLGVQTGNFYQANPGTSAFQNISNNTIQARRVGVFHNLHYSSASPFTLAGNTITGLANANETGVRGMLFGSLSVPSFATNNAINLSTISATTTGYEVWNVKNTSPVSISGGSITGVNTGVYLNNYEGYASDAGDGAHANITGPMTINPNVAGIGVRLLDSPSSTTHAKVNATVSGVTINGGVEGIKLEQTSVAGAAVGGSFTGNTITAAAAGINVTRATLSSTNPLTISGNGVTVTNQVVGGSTPTAGISLANVTSTSLNTAATIDNNNITGPFYGYGIFNLNTTQVTTINGGTITGVMQGVAGSNLFPPSTFAPSTFNVNGITMSGFTGNHPSVTGANFHAGVYAFTGGPAGANSITSTISNVNVSGTGKIAQDCAGLSFADFSTGVGTMQNVTVRSSIVNSNLNRGVNVRGTNALVDISTSTFENNGGDPYGLGGNDGFGVIARQGAVLTIDSSFIKNPSTVAGGYNVSALTADPGTAGSVSVTATHNSITPNGNVTSKLANNGGGTLNANCNWWGSACEPEFSPYFSGVVTYTEWLVGNSDGAGTGFQPTDACRDNNATITGPATACLNTTNHIYITESGRGIYNWVVTGGTITAGGGTGDNTVTVSWNTTSGAKTVSVYHTNNGCDSPVFVYNVTVNPLPIAGTCDVTNDGCQVGAGEIKVAASGGTGTLNVTWAGYPQAPFTGPVTGTPAGSAQPIPTAGPTAGYIIYSNLSGNTQYKFKVTDANGCSVGEN